MTYYLKCTYSTGMLPNEKVVEFRVTRPVYEPMMRSDYGKKFCWFVDGKDIIPIDETNALLRLISFAVRNTEAGIAFSISGNHADLRHYTSGSSLCSCRVPLEDIVERDSPQEARYLYETSKRILRKRDEENRKLMAEVKEMLRKEGGAKMNEDYTKEDLEASLRRAFVDGRADFIIMDGQTMRSQFLVDGVNYGIDRGWLKPGRDLEEQQYFAYTYRLTKKGMEHFGVKK